MGLLSSDIFKDTGHQAIFIDDHQICEVSGDTLRYDPLQGQTSSVINVGVWDHRSQLLTKSHSFLENTLQRTEPT